MGVIFRNREDQLMRSGSETDHNLALASRLLGATILACVVMIVLPIIIGQALQSSAQSTTLLQVVSRPAPMAAIGQRSHPLPKPQLPPARLIVESK